MVQPDIGGAADPFQRIAIAIGIIAAQHRHRLPGQRAADLGQARQALPVIPAVQQHALGIEHQNRCQRRCLGLIDGRRHPFRHGKGNRIGPLRRIGRRSFFQDGRKTQIDGGRWNRVIAIIQPGCRPVGGHRRGGCKGPRTGPEQRRARPQRGTLGHQLGFGSPHQRVFIHPQPHRAGAGQGGDE